MPHTPHGWIISTLADHVEADNSLTLHCQCGHCLDVSLPMLVDKFGPDFDLVKNRAAFLQRFVCNSCGARPRQVTTSPVETPRF